MEFKIADLADVLNGNIVHTRGDGSVLVNIAGKEHVLRLLKSGSGEFEFIMDDSFHHAKIIQSSSSEAKILLDGQPVTVKKHSKLTEILEKSSSLGRIGRSENNLASQIPGRVVSISAKTGDSVKKGDVIAVLESMKMQVAVKAHKDGDVKEIRVKQGVTVARNDVIAVIE